MFYQIDVNKDVQLTVSLMTNQLFSNLIVHTKMCGNTNNEIWEERKQEYPSKKPLSWWIGDCQLFKDECWLCWLRHKLVFNVVNSDTICLWNRSFSAVDHMIWWLQDRAVHHKIAKLNTL